MKRSFKLLSSFKSLTAILGAAALTLFLVPASNAACGGPVTPVASHVSWSPELLSAQPRGAHFVMANDLLDLIDPIVGMWHVKFVVKGSTSTAPDGAEFDAGYSIWHGDGTEIMNSGGRPPQSGDFCLGVWEKVRDHEYKLNHFAAAWDSTGSTFLGPAQIQEQITLDRNGNSFSGTFTVDQFVETNGVLNPIPVAHFQGNITGTRITVNTPAQSVF
jgi:hypothetical protein